MVNRSKLSAAAAAALLGGIVGAMCLIAAENAPLDRGLLKKAFDDGNFKNAYDGYRQLALDPKDDPAQVGEDLRMGVDCLNRLGRQDEINDLLEQVVELHGKNWRLLWSAAQRYGEIEHSGALVAGKYQRGQRRGDATIVNSFDRDRVRALQLMTAARAKAPADAPKNELADFYSAWAGIWFGQQDAGGAWRLQVLTDLATLPDYEQGWFYGRADRGAPVDAAGNPVFYPVGASLETAANDGQRWRWCLTQVAELAPERANEVRWIFAEFLHGQFGTQTMAQFGWFAGNDGTEDKPGEATGTYALDTLADDETIARLATGVKRFKLPDEFNYIKLYEAITAEPKAPYAKESVERLANVFQNRRQYDRAAGYWRLLIERYGATRERNEAFDQIVGNWGRFENVSLQPARRGGTVDYRFRNGTRVQFEAHEILVPKLLADVKAYLKSGPGQLDWQKLQVADLGYRLVQSRQATYIGRRVASWELPLEPRDKHFDKRVTVATPLQKPGAYWVTAKMAGGNTCHIILWIADTAIVKKQLAGQSYCFVADAVTGAPIAKANLEFFGYRQTHLGQNRYRVDTKNFALGTDADGQATLKWRDDMEGYQWLIVATAGEGRLAYLGFSGIWNAPADREIYDQTKVFAITDRPVYRPGQTVKFKLWVARAKYDEPDGSAFANRPYKVEVRDARGEKVLEKEYTADAYGGLEGELTLAADASLGMYQVSIPDLGGGGFRVEEYKKPEFEVAIEAPMRPIMLGEKITATIRAKYYFGAPVTKARVKYKVLRSSYTERWFPVRPWDWCYGPGYWWFAADSAWYPGWREWGTLRPAFSWWPRRQDPPELVSENEVAIGADGTVAIEIDTALAKAIHGDEDHRYEITAEVVDESRRTIVGTGSVMAARKPFAVHVWVDRGYFRVGDTIRAQVAALTLDQKGVAGSAKFSLLKITYNERHEPVETPVESWELKTDAEGRADLQIKAAAAGQYRLSCQVTDESGHTIEGAYLLTVIGEGFDSVNYRFNNIELIADQAEFHPGDKLKLLVNTDRVDSTVLLFVRAAAGVYPVPQVLRLKGKSTLVEIDVKQADMPNFFIEALVIADGKLHQEVRQIVVPPEKRVVNVAVVPSAEKYRPGEKAKVKLQLTGLDGRPVIGSTVVSIYDKAVEYVSGGSNVPEIREFFWQWQRRYYPQTETSLERLGYNLQYPDEKPMQDLGVFGGTVADEGGRLRDGVARKAQAMGGAPGAAPPAPMAEAAALGAAPPPSEAAPAALPAVEPTVRTKFADTALWVGSLTTNNDGVAEVELDMPENLTTWKVNVWAMGHGTRVGQGTAEAVTYKNLIVRMQAPRFFVETDEVVLSANIHNYLATAKPVQAILELEGDALAAISGGPQTIEIAAGGEQRVDWRVKAVKEGEAVIRMKALTDEESDAVEMRFPVYVHGMLKMDSFTGMLRPDRESAKIEITVPAKRRVEQSRLEVRYSPTLAGAMVDALPYLVEYPYGCTEQTLNRFLPTVVTQKVLLELKVNLKEIQENRTNLNPQEIGDDRARAEGWKRYDRNPVFDEDEVRRMVQAGLEALTEMQLADGGWGWFSGYGEHSDAHMTALVVHGLQTAAANDVALVPGVVERGLAWLAAYQDEQVRRIQNAPAKKDPYKTHADNLDALVYMVLVDAGTENGQMLEFLYRDRTELSVYAKAMFGLALVKQKQERMLAMVKENIEQFLVRDEENQTAYLRLPDDNYWWHWYGSETEANAYYLKLLVATEPKGQTAPRLVKYLLNNRKHATYWNSTRDTALAIEALADYLRASGEQQSDLTVEVWLDGKKRHEVAITPATLFTFDNKFVLTGEAVEPGVHQIELRKRGQGPLYFNAYLTYFSLEEHLTHAGLELKVARKYYRLIPEEKKIDVAGSQGQAVKERVEKYRREELPNLATLKSGDLVEIELEIDSKNDYEYLLFEDMKAAGFEPVDVRSGYTASGLGAYTELRDNRVAMFVRQMLRGKHSMSYRVRAEIPGRFSALPTRASAMYAPELKGNSDEIKLLIED